MDEPRPYLARVTDAKENVVGHVDFPDYVHMPRFIRDEATGKTYQAEHDDFCCFSHYEEIEVQTVRVKA